jgi:hypothetical protein
MNANETKLAQSKMQASVSLWASVFTTIRFICMCLTILGALKLIFAGLHDQSPESIGAIAKVIQAMNLGSILGYGWGVVATGAWAVERTARKKRNSGTNG